MAAELAEQPPPAGREQQERRSTGESRGIDHLPAVEKAVIGEVAQPHLGGADAVKEELLHLQGSQVPIVVQRLEDGDVPLGEGAQEPGGVFLGQGGAGMFAKIAKNDGTTMYGSPSRYRIAPITAGWNSERHRADGRSLNRRRRRRGRRESGSEAIIQLGEVGIGVPMGHVGVQKVIVAAGSFVRDAAALAVVVRHPVCCCGLPFGRGHVVGFHLSLKGRFPRPFSYIHLVKSRPGSRFRRSTC
jgi:hypothetical protein